MRPSYTEFHAHSAFSFLDGASTPVELAGRAAALGYARPRRSLSRIADLASRSGVGRADLEKLAWAGALDLLPVEGAGADGDRRRRYWQVGVADASRRHGDGRQLGLPMEPAAAPESLQPLGSWELAVENYRATGINLGKHPWSSFGPPSASASRRAPTST